MEAIFGYLIKSALFTCLFFGLYWYFLRNETFYRFNRFFLLGGIFCSIFLPFASFSYLVEVQSALLPQQLLIRSPSDFNDIQPIWKQLLFAAYLLVVLLLTLRQVLGFLKIQAIARRSGHVRYKGYKLVNSSGLESSFSMGSYIFLGVPSSTSAVEKRLILAHELAHVEQYHFLDLLLCQFLCSLQWFNPIAWLYLRSVRENHEFLADESVLAQGNSGALYRAALINHSLKVPVFVFASPFLGISKARRIKMMLREDSSPLKKWRILLVLPAISLLFAAFAEPRYIVLQTRLDQEIPAGERRIAPKRASVANISRKRDRQLPPIIPTKPVAFQVDSAAFLERDTSILAMDDAHTPMLVVDGVESNLPINSLTSADIESIFIHKDHMAVVKFGPRGRNGVIEVVLKKVSAAGEKEDGN